MLRSFLDRIRKIYNTIYLIRSGALGDVLWAELVLRELCLQNKNIILITRFEEVFNNYPYPRLLIKKKLSKLEKILMAVNRMIPLKRFFINLDNSYEKNPKQHLLKSYFETAKFFLPLSYPRLYFSENEEKQLPYNQPYAVLHLENSTGKNYRDVYGIDWSIINANLAQRGFKVLQVGTKDQQIPGAEYFPTKNFRALMVLIKNSSFFIGLDSGPSHIAACQKVPALIFFGSVNPLYRHLPGQFKGYFLQQPCIYDGCYHEVISTITGQTCKIVGDTGVPPCSLHTNKYVLDHIDLIMKTYVERSQSTDKTEPED